MSTADAGRPAALGALERAIAAVVRQETSSSIASGTGILGLMAARGRSARLCIDDGGIIELARALARANSFVDRMRFVLGARERLNSPSVRTC